MLAENLSVPAGSRAAHRTVASVEFRNLVVTRQAHRVHTLTSAPVPLHPGRVDPTLPRATGRSAAGAVNRCCSSSRRVSRPPQSPGQSPALSPAPRGGWLGPAPLPDATTCARSGAAFVRRFTAKRAPRARPDPAPGPRGAAARQARQDQAQPRAQGPAVTWRRSDNFDPPRHPPHLGLGRRSARSPQGLPRPTLASRTGSLPSSAPPFLSVRSGLVYTAPRFSAAPSPSPPSSNNRSAPSSGGRPRPEPTIPRHRPRPRPLASGTAMGGGGAMGGGARRGVGGRTGASSPAHSEVSRLRRCKEATGVLPPSEARDARAAAARPSCHSAAATHPAPGQRRERPRGAVTSRRAALPDGGTVAPDPGEGGGARQRAGSRTCFASSVCPSLPGMAGAAARRDRWGALTGGRSSPLHSSASLACSLPPARSPLPPSSTPALSSPGRRRGRRGSGHPQAPAGLESGGWNPPGALNSRAPRCCVSASSWGPGPGGRSGGRGRAGPSGGRARLAGAGGRRGPDGRGRQSDGRAAGAGLRDPLRRSRFPHKLPES